MKNLVRNEATHAGLPLRMLILEHESYDDYLDLEAHWFRGYNVNPEHPGANPVEVSLVRSAARADWFLCRAERNYAHVEAELKRRMPNLLSWHPEHHRMLSQFSRYRTIHASCLTKACRAVEDFNKARAREVAAAQKLHRENEKKKRLS